MTSQPSMGAIVNHFMRDGQSMCGVDPKELNELNEYWESARQLYSPFGVWVRMLLVAERKQCCIEARAHCFCDAHLCL